MKAEVTGAMEAGRRSCEEASSPAVVQLRYAPLPYVLRVIAVHHWFVVLNSETGRADRWEVWQNRDAGGESWGHLHRNLMHPDRGVGGGPAVITAEWTGESAASLRAILEESPTSYPFRDLYRYWPGPNSNTYAAWALQEAGIDFRFGWRAFGRRWASARSSALPPQTDSALTGKSSV